MTPERAGCSEPLPTLPLALPSLCPQGSPGRGSPPAAPAAGRERGHGAGMEAHSCPMDPTGTRERSQLTPSPLCSRFPRGSLSPRHIRVCPRAPRPAQPLPTSNPGGRNWRLGVRTRSHAQPRRCTWFVPSLCLPVTAKGPEALPGPLWRVGGRRTGEMTSHSSLLPPGWMDGCWPHGPGGFPLIPGQGRSCPAMGMG